MRSKLIKTILYVGSPNQKQIIHKRLNYKLADLFLIILLICVVILCWVGSKGMHATIDIRHIKPLSLDWEKLPYYSLRTSLRLFLGMAWSLIFAFIAGTLAAKCKHAERIILPFINFMESVPLVGFLTISTIIFMALYPRNTMGLECVAIFAVFTGQAWNMALTLYQTIRVVPKELYDAANSFHLSKWQQFWKIELPYSIPGLLWNMMVSQSAAWFAIVGSEAITVKSTTIYLPGIGSYIQTAINSSNYLAIIYSIIAMVINIILIDQFAFRPLVIWSEKFKFERMKSRTLGSSWFYTVITKAVIIQLICRMLMKYICYLKYYFFLILNRLVRQQHKNKTCSQRNTLHKTVLLCWYTALFIISAYVSFCLIRYLPNFNIDHILMLMLLTTTRVAIAMIASLIIFVPLGIWIGFNARLTRTLQPVTQILAALPPNILYPLMAIFLIYFHQSLDWWSIPMIMIGTQWYILFNVIAGVRTIPQDILDLSKNYNATGFYYWRNVIIPAIFPYIVTGIISAAGGAWNADITAEIIQWGGKTLKADGLGAFISKNADANFIPQEALGCILMCILVALCVIFIWKPLYRLAENKFNVR